MVPFAKVSFWYIYLSHSTLRREPPFWLGLRGNPKESPTILGSGPPKKGPGASYMFWSNQSRGHTRCSASEHHRSLWNPWVTPNMAVLLSEHGQYMKHVLLWAARSLFFSAPKWWVFPCSKNGTPSLAQESAWWRGTSCRWHIWRGASIT